MTESVRIAVLGAADLHTGVALAACFANCFPERPVEVCLSDADAERLELIERLWRVLVATNRNPLKVGATDSPEEALEGSSGLIVASGSWSGVQPTVEVFRCRPNEPWIRWPKAEDLGFWPHQVLRWVRGDEYAFTLLADHEDSPIPSWIETILSRSKE